MIGFNGKTVTGISLFKEGVLHVITSVSLGAKLLWEFAGNIASCFSNGYWDMDEPWTKDEPWRDI